MARDPGENLRRGLWVLAASAVPGLATGYALFYAVFPSASFPTASDASIAWILLCLFVGASAGGFVSRDMAGALIAAFVSIPLGIVVTLLLSYAPGATGSYFIDPSFIPVFVLHYGVVILVLAFPVNLVSSLVGQAGRGAYLMRYGPDRLAR